jgi:deoxyribodipyrimidine photo-lyase
MRKSIVWFRQDLRLEDNQALMKAVSNSDEVIPVFIWSPEEELQWRPGGASRVWLHFSLLSLSESLKQLGSKLIIIRRGKAAQTLADFATEYGADAVYCNQRIEPRGRMQEASVEAALVRNGITFESIFDGFLFEPNKTFTQKGSPFQVFTPFWKACLAGKSPEHPLSAPNSLGKSAAGINSLAVTQLALLPEIKWDKGIREYWKPGRAGAMAQLQNLTSEVIESYTTARDVPADDLTSRLSPHLHFGEISAREVWHAVESRISSLGRSKSHKDWIASARVYQKELGWREFANHLLYHFPQTAEQPLRGDFRNFPWRRDDDELRAWQKGTTGFPIVDAGMRQLWELGWMHNRVRMIVASFLVKDLILPWQSGASWFWDTLVDADLANNTLGWQWSAGCGADAAPYFRIFNPVLQGQRFDPEGEYVRRWVPELRQLPAKWIHHPWDAPPHVLQSANITLGQTYPKPMVDHSIARKRALEAFDAVRKTPVST